MITPRTTLISMANRRAEKNPEITPIPIETEPTCIMKKKVTINLINTLKEI